jgi:hypothetical protein
VLHNSPNILSSSVVESLLILFLFVDLRCETIESLPVFGRHQIPTAGRCSGTLRLEEVTIATEGSLKVTIDQWPFQDPKMEVPIPLI